MIAITSTLPASDVQETALVLIAEDEEPLAETVAYAVRESGYTPIVALHGRQALELARARRPALLILDLMLPFIDGTAIIAALREDAKASGTVPPIILMTGASLVQARSAGADVVLRKPFHLADLERLLHQFLASASKAAATQKDPVTE
jgi:two-component system alkaline phosphatase synthesis response regulator PhoP